MRRTETERLEKICLVHTGGHGEAVAWERAMLLSEQSDAELTVLAVAETPPPGLARLMESLHLASADSGHAVSDFTALEVLVESARRRNIRTRVEALRGPAAQQIIDYLQQNPHQLLIKAANPSDTVHRVLFGHTDRQLFRKCPCPVWVVNPTAPTDCARVLAAVDPPPLDDGLERDPVREQLNRSILQTAVDFSHLLGAELHVAHAWRFFLEGQFRHRAGLSDGELAKLEESCRNTHVHALGALVRPYAQHIAHVHLLNGDAATEISQLAASEPFDTIVMGTICRTGIAGWVLGNTAETVLNQVNCSVVALKPGGLVSAVGAEA